MSGRSGSTLSGASPSTSATRWRKYSMSRWRRRRPASPGAALHGQRRPGAPRTVLNNRGRRKGGLVRIHNESGLYLDRGRMVAVGQAVMVRHGASVAFDFDQAARSHRYFLVCPHRRARTARAARDSPVTGRNGQRARPATIRRRSPERKERLPTIASSPSPRRHAVATRGQAALVRGNQGDCLMAEARTGCGPTSRKTSNPSSRHNRRGLRGIGRVRSWPGGERSRRPPGSSSRRHTLPRLRRCRRRQPGSGRPPTIAKAPPARPRG